MVPNTRPAARPPKTRRSSKSVWSTRGRSNRRRETQRIPMPGRIPRRNATKKSRFEAIVAEQAWALLKPASGKVSGVTTGNATLWAARRLARTVDARETGPGPLSRLPGAYPSGRDGVRELRGLRDGRGGRAAQPSPRPRPRARAEIVRGGLPPSEAIARSRPKSGPREGGGRAPVHLHELRSLRRRGRHEVPAVCRGIRGRRRRGSRGRGGHPRPRPLSRLRGRQRSGPRRMRNLRRVPPRTGDETSRRGRAQGAGPSSEGPGTRRDAREGRRLPAGI